MSLINNQADLYNIYYKYTKNIIYKINYFVILKSLPEY